MLGSRKKQERKKQMNKKIMLIVVSLIFLFIVSTILDISFLSKYIPLENLSFQFKLIYYLTRNLIEIALVFSGLFIGYLIWGKKK